MKTSYEIWILGYDENGYANDFEELVCGDIEKKKYAMKIFNCVEQIIHKPICTPNATLVLEQVETDDEGNITCVDSLVETEL